MRWTWFGLDATKQTARPVASSERTAADAVDGERAAVIEAEIGATIATLLAARCVAIEVGEELAQFVLSDENLPRRRGEARPFVVAQHFL